MSKKQVPSSSLLSFRSPYPYSSKITTVYPATYQPPISKYPTMLTPQKITSNTQSFSLTNTPIITLSKKKNPRPLYFIKTTQYRNKQTGELIQYIEHSQEVGKVYDYSKMPDFYVDSQRMDRNSIDDMKDMLRRKILDQQYNLDDYKFVAKPVQFLKGFNLTISNADMLVNKLKGPKNQFKSQHISYIDPIPNGPDTIPTYVQNLKIYNTVQEYLKKRPCWLRNVLEYQLRLDGFKGQYTLNQLKNILKFVCYTYRDGPWKHTFCRFGYNPTQNKQSTLYQILMVKIKRKQVQDYDQTLSQQNDIYDPTLREMPTKYMRIYQLCDIEDKRVEELIKVTAALSEQCNKETGWFSKTEYNQLQKITKSIREERTKT